MSGVSGAVRRKIIRVNGKSYSSRTVTPIKTVSPKNQQEKNIPQTKPIISNTTSLQNHEIDNESLVKLITAKDEKATRILLRPSDVVPIIEISKILSVCEEYQIDYWRAIVVGGKYESQYKTDKEISSLKKAEHVYNVLVPSYEFNCFIDSLKAGHSIEDILNKLVDINRLVIVK